jgi:hypothetical protein
MSDKEREAEEFEDLGASTPNSTGPKGAAGGMGVSSEREGPAGPGGEQRTDGGRDTSAGGRPDDGPPEQAPGAPEDNPVGLRPKAGYSSVDPRSRDDESEEDR